ncbi:MAG: TonB-dependent siderophore receptor [Pseudomonadota bacterium]
MSVSTHALRMVAFLASTALCSGAAFAQDGAPDLSVSEDADGSEIRAADTVETIEDGDRIIVTAPGYVPNTGFSANKTNIPLIRTPQTISVVNRDQFDLLNFVDAQQAVRYVAGVSGENFGPDLRFDFLTVRGFVPRQYIDGLVAPSTTTIASTGVDLYAFESLEILKGPVSSLYGNAPPGGIYNQTSRQPEDQLDGELRVRVGTDDFAEIAGTLTGAVLEGVNGRITALYRDRGAERDFVDAERFLIAPVVDIELGIDTTVRLNGYYQYDEIRGDTNGFLPAAGTIDPNPNGELPRSANLGDPDNLYERDQYAIGARLTHEFQPGLLVDINVRYNDYNEDTPQSVTPTAGSFTNTTDASDPSFFNTITRSNFTFFEDVEAFTADGRLDAEFATGRLEHKLLAGVDFRTVSNDASFGFFFDPPTIDIFNPVFEPVPQPADPAPFGFNDQRLQQTGLYVQNQIGLDNLYLTLGLRYDIVDIRDRAAGTDSDENELSWRTGLTYESDIGLAPYISYSRSFEPVLGNDAITGEAFNASQGDQYEIGIKYDGRTLPGGVDVFATASVFHIQQSNVVATGSASIIPAFGTQAGEVELTGFEFEAVARINDQFSINASYSYTDSEVTESENFPGEIGAELPVTPEHKGSVFATYNIQVGPLAGFGIGAGARYTSSSAGSLPGLFNPEVIFGEDAFLVDAIVSYDTPDWRFAVNASNLFDKRYVARCLNATGCNFGAGLQVLGTVAYKF